MKKIVVSVSMLVAVLLCASCSCAKDKYEFYSFDYNSKTYKCSNSDKKDPQIKSMCNSFDSFSISLKSNGKAVINISGLGMNNEETNYKIENDTLYIKDDDELDYNRLGTCKDGKITISISGVKIILKK